MEFRILRVGRGELAADGRKNDIEVNHPSVSRSHLEVFIDAEGNVFITDLQSRNGTYVNGNAVTANTLLRNGDILRLGSSKPLQWKKWIDGSWQSAQAVEELPQEERASTSQLMLQTEAASRPLSSRPVFWIALLLPLLLAIGLLVWWYRDGGRQEAHSPKTGEIYTRIQLEHSTFEHLRQLASDRVEVVNLVDGERLFSSDHYSVLLSVREGKLIGISKIGSAEEPMAMDRGRAGVDSFSRASARVGDTVGKTRTDLVDSDGDGVEDARDQCPTIKGNKPSGCLSDKTYWLKKASAGVFRLQVLGGGETVRAFRNRILKSQFQVGGYSGYITCASPSKTEDILYMNDLDDMDGLGDSMVLEEYTWVLFSCN